MNFQQYFTSTVLPELKTVKPLITLKKCTRCKSAFDGFNFKFNARKKTYLKQCLICQEKQMKSVMKHYNKNKGNEEYREKVKGYRKTYRQSEGYKHFCNTDEFKEKKTQYRSKPEAKEKRNINQRKRRENDMRFKLRQNVGRRIHKALINYNKSGKMTSTIQYLGCSMDVFVKHIEKQFKEGMNWDNYGRSSCSGEGETDEYWEIDHITPINYNNPTLDDVKERLIYTNCQPMWAAENRSKSNRYIG